MMAVMASAELITGIVGLAGVLIGTAGTLLASWQTGKSQTKNVMFRVQADDERARLAEKRSIYARYMATLTGDLAAVTRLGAEKGASAELRDIRPEGQFRLRHPRTDPSPPQQAPGRFIHATHEANYSELSITRRVRCRAALSYPRMLPEWTCGDDALRASLRERPDELRGLVAALADRLAASARAG